MAPETYQIANWQTGERMVDGNRNFPDIKVACERIKKLNLDRDTWGVLGSKNLVEFIQAIRARNLSRAKACLRFCSK